MVASMTGFARREFAGPFGTLVCEIRSVNHRFLDATLRLPDSCRALEPELRQLIARELRRGKVDCTLQQRSLPAGAAALEIDQEALKRLLARVNELSAAIPGRSQVDLIELLRFPGILREDSTDAETLMQSVRSLFAETLTELARARAREGERLAAAVSQRRRAPARLGRAGPRSPPWSARYARACRRCRPGCGRVSRSACASWVPRSIRSASSRRSCCCCSASMSPRSSTVWTDIWWKPRARSQATRRSGGGWIF